MPWTLHLLSCDGVVSGQYDRCVFGDRLDVHVRYLSSVPAAASWSRKCDGTHEHGHRARERSQAEHLPAWCSLVCDAVGATLPATAEVQPLVEPPADWSGRVATETLARRVAAGKQPHGKRWAPLIPEDKSVVEMIVPPDVMDHSWKRSRTEGRLLTSEVDIPKGARKIEVRGDRSGPLQVKVGLPWSEDEFFQQAILAGNPFDRPPVVDSAFVSATRSIAELGPSGFEDHLRTVIGRVRSRCLALQAEEDRLHSTLNSDVEAVIAGKRSHLCVLRQCVARCVMAMITPTPELQGLALTIKGLKKVGKN